MRRGRWTILALHPTWGEWRPGWYGHWLDGLRAGLAAHQINYDLIMLDELPEEWPAVPAASGPVFLTTHALYGLIDQTPPGRPVIIQDHALPGEFGLNMSEDTMQIYRHAHLRLVSTTTRSMAAWLTGHYHVPTQVIAGGFPYRNHELNDSGLIPWKERPQRVVFPQRLCEENGPIVAARIAYALMECGWEVIFATPHIPEESPYALERWKRDGLQVMEATQPELYTLLRTARYVVSTTQIGSMVIGCYEGVRLGCRAIVPWGNGRSPFTDPFQARYYVTCSESVVEAITTDYSHHDYGVDHDAFDPVAYVGRLAAAL